MTQLKELEISGTLIKDISPLQYTSKLEVFTSPKLIGVFKKEFKEKGIKTISKD